RNDQVWFSVFGVSSSGTGFNQSSLVMIFGREAGFCLEELDGASRVLEVFQAKDFYTRGCFEEEASESCFFFLLCGGGGGSVVVIVVVVVVKMVTMDSTLVSTLAFPGSSFVDLSLMNRSSKVKASSIFFIDKRVPDELCGFSMWTCSSFVSFKLLCTSGHNIHKRPQSPVYITVDDYQLDNLKFVSKGGVDEVFRMPILKDMITDVIQNSEYYKKYLEMASRKPRQLTTVIDEEGGKKKKAPKAVYPEVHKSLKLTNEEQVHIENPQSSSGTLSSIKNMEDAFTFDDLFINDKSTKEEPGKANVETKVESIVTVPIH
nr:hypothetical protein [Tanacetum cinerariifolium]